METIKELGLLALLGLILYGVLRTVSEFFKNACAEDEQKLLEEEQKKLRNLDKPLDSKDTQAESFLEKLKRDDRLRKDYESSVVMPMAKRRENKPSYSSFTNDSLYGLGPVSTSPIDLDTGSSLSGSAYGSDIPHNLDTYGHGGSFSGGGASGSWDSGHSNLSDHSSYDSDSSSDTSSSWSD